MYEWEDLLDFLRRHKLPVKDVIAKRIRIGEAIEAFKLADSATDRQDHDRLDLIPGMSAQRPHVLLLVTDQQRGDCLGIDGPSGVADAGDGRDRGDG